MAKLIKSAAVLGNCRSAPYPHGHQIKDPAIFIYCTQFQLYRVLSGPNRSRDKCLLRDGFTRPLPQMEVIYQKQRRWLGSHHLEIRRARKALPRTFCLIRCCHLGLTVLGLWVVAFLLCCWQPEINTHIQVILLSSVFVFGADGSPGDILAGKSVCCAYLMAYANAEGPKWLKGLYIYESNNATKTYLTRSHCVLYLRLSTICNPCQMSQEDPKQTTWPQFPSPVALKTPIRIRLRSCPKSNGPYFCLSSDRMSYRWVFFDLAYLKYSPFISFLNWRNGD